MIGWGKMGEPAVLLYDNGCGVCHWLVRLVLRNDPAGRFMFAPLDSPAGEALGRRHLGNRVVDSVVLIDEGNAFIRSDAVIHIARRLGWPWRLLAVMNVLPQRWRDAGYDRFAARREAVSRRFGLRCALPTIEEQARFLDR